MSYIHAKKYIDFNSLNTKPVNVVNSVPQELHSDEPDNDACKDRHFTKSENTYPGPAKLENSDSLKNLDQKLAYFDQSRFELKQQIHEYEHLFPDIPTRSDKIYHDVVIVDSKAIKQHPYRMNPLKQQYLIREEVKYLLDNDL